VDRSGWVVWLELCAIAVSTETTTMKTVQRGPGNTRRGSSLLQENDERGATGKCVVACMYLYFGCSSRLSWSVERVVVRMAVSRVGCRRREKRRRRTVELRNGESGAFCWTAADKRWEGAGAARDWGKTRGQGCPDLWGPIRPRPVRIVPDLLTPRAEVRASERARASPVPCSWTVPTAHCADGAGILPLSREWWQEKQPMATQAGMTTSAGCTVGTGVIHCAAPPCPTLEPRSSGQ